MRHCRLEHSSTPHSTLDNSYVHRPASPSSPSATSTSSSRGERELRRVDSRRRHARRRGRRALRRVLSELRRAGRDAGAWTRWRETGQISSMLCFSPDFTHPDPDERLRQVERQKAAIDLSGAHRRPVLPDAERAEVPGLSIAEGVARAAECITRSLEYAGEARRHPVPREPLQGRRLALPRVRAAGGAVPRAARRACGSRRTSASSTTRRTPSSAASIRSRSSRRSSTGSSRCTRRIGISCPGTTLEEIRAGRRHRRLSRQAAPRRDGTRARTTTTPSSASCGVGEFAGWISVEDGMNGLDELARSVEFLKAEAQRRITTARRLSDSFQCDDRLARDEGDRPAGPVSSSQRYRTCASARAHHARSATVPRRPSGASWRSGRPSGSPRARSPTSSRAG